MAGDGLEAWGLLEEGNGPFALLVVDLGMPRWDGTTLIRRVRAEQPAQRVLVITGHPELLQALPPSMSILLKPFSPTDLVRAVRLALNPRSLAGPSRLPA
jgi:two-component system, response regulator YesN